MIVYSCLLIMTLMGSVASLFLKRASGSDGIKSMLLDINIYVGGGLYAYSARTAHPFRRNGAPFRFKLSKAQLVD